MYDMLPMERHMRLVPKMERFVYGRLIQSSNSMDVKLILVLRSNNHKYSTQYSVAVVTIENTKTTSLARMYEHPFIWIFTCNTPHSLFPLSLVGLQVHGRHGKHAILHAKLENWSPSLTLSSCWQETCNDNLGRNPNRNT